MYNITVGFSERMSTFDLHKYVLRLRLTRVIAPVLRLHLNGMEWGTHCIAFINSNILTQKYKTVKQI